MIATYRDRALSAGLSTGSRCGRWKLSWDLMLMGMVLYTILGVPYQLSTSSPLLARSDNLFGTLYC